MLLYTYSSRTSEMFINQVHHAANHNGRRSDIRPRDIKANDKMSGASTREIEQLFTFQFTNYYQTINYFIRNYVFCARRIISGTVDIWHNLLTSTQGICSGRKCHNISTFFEEQRGDCSAFLQAVKVSHSLHAL